MFSVGLLTIAITPGTTGSLLVTLAKIRSQSFAKVVAMSTSLLAVGDCAKTL
jgi:hypothetical protein